MLLWHTSFPQKPRKTQDEARHHGCADGMYRRHILTQSVVMFGDDTKHTRSPSTEDFDNFKMLHHHHCCEASSIIYQYCVRLCHHGMVPCAYRGLYMSLPVSPPGGRTMVNILLHWAAHNDSAWNMNQGSREERVKAKGRSTEQSNGGDKESSKKEFSKSKQASNRNDDKKMGEMSMTWERGFHVYRKINHRWMGVKTQCKHLLIICFYCVYFGVEGVVILPHL